MVFIAATYPGFVAAELRFLLSNYVPTPPLPFQATNRKLFSPSVRELSECCL